MTMQKLRGGLFENRRIVGFGLAALLIIATLMLYKLGSLAGGLSRGEITTASAPVGWHGIYHNAFYLPLNAVRSVVFFVSPAHGQTLTRLPNALFGGIAILCFGGLVRLWHGNRTALLATLMFATSSWVLHASRLASFDVMYLAALPALLFSHFLLRRYYQKSPAWFLNLVIWGLLLYIPGMVWLVAADLISQRRLMRSTWRYVSSWWQRILYVIAGLIWLPLLIDNLTRPGKLLFWLGIPSHFVKVTTLVKQFIAVPIHLFIRGPEYPQIWLGRAPIMDVFTMVVCALGIYFYATHWRASRSRYLTIMACLGFVLVGIGGPVGLSLLVPLLYMSAATGLAYLLLEWLKTFPNNPLARGLGIGLIVFAVGLSCVYNLRSYFIAWPHTTTTRATFQYRRQP